ncbi:EAL domain-containing protein [Candidatus Frankia nodulisporulans]|uniref:EAL domain-containing protein n=1 Tax=Candidatus Frankia nodulisporulans TaxID=2060052 RepID=UPI0013CFBB85|nr:EAL domain-containing protein [Candidatus Frankia nodulisporulans]
MTVPATAGGLPPDLTLVPALYAAFDDGSLRLHFQPEVDLRTGSVPGMEAHPRWQHPERGVLGPAEFMPIAAAAGLVHQVDQWVLRMAVTEARTWHRMAVGTPIRPPRLWVNIDGRQLASPAFVTEVDRLMSGRLLPAGAIGLEFSERALGLAAPVVPGLLAHLHALGVALAVESFGTWFGSLAVLDLLPLDLVKLDGLYLQATMRDLEGEAVVAAIVRLAHSRALTVVADGVDSARLATRVHDLGCDRAIGPVFCPPVPVEDARMIALGRGRPERWHRPSQRTDERLRAWVSAAGPRS